MSSHTSARVLQLYRQILRESRKFTSYNYRIYALKRTRDAFKENKNVADSGAIQKLIAKAEHDLDIIKRQVVVGQMYSYPKLVVELMEQRKA